MKDSDIDRILSGPDRIAPSAGFADSVMEAVRREALRPAEVQVSWSRVLAGLFAAVMGLAWLTEQSMHGMVQQNGGGSFDLRPFLDAAIRVQEDFGAGWIVLALLLSFLSVKLSSWAVSKTVSGT
jgi:hypothetical protein